MKAFYPGDCPLCGLPWAAGEPIAKWLGKWSHEGCKALRRASIASEGKRTTLPDNMEGLAKFVSRKQYVRPGEGRTRGIKKIV